MGSRNLSTIKKLINRNGIEKRKIKRKGVRSIEKELTREKTNNNF